MPPAVEPLEISITVLAQLFLYLEALKVDVDAYLRSLGVDPASVKSPDAYIPLETYLLIQESAARYTNDPYFGLHAGEYAGPGTWSILGYMMMNCRTLGEAFEKANRYSRIIGNLIQARAEPRINKIKVIFETPPYAPDMSRHCIETVFSSTARMMQTLTGARLYPLEITFTYPEPESRAEYERIFHCPVHFGRRENAFVMDWSHITQPVLMANAPLLEYFEKYAQDFIAQMDRPNNEHTRAVTKILLARLDDESLSIQKVAREMAVSVRTLQKRLEAEGTDFSELLRDTRERLAKQYLRENYTAEQITYLLGFSEPSVFRKSFKKWTGRTPKEYRQSLVDG